MRATKVARIFFAKNANYCNKSILRVCVIGYALSTIKINT